MWLLTLIALEPVDGHVLNPHKILGFKDEESCKAVSSMDAVYVDGVYWKVDAPCLDVS